MNEAQALSPIPYENAILWPSDTDLQVPPVAYKHKPENQNSPTLADRTRRNSRVIFSLATHAVIGLDVSSGKLVRKC